ncbi:MAG: hypothetical protein H5U40_02975, partial [Polyangiaceae bacterium]|nr:hypothetical protein [Polyangiaceae bacterium]
LDLRNVSIRGSVRSKEDLALRIDRASLRAEHDGAVLFRTRDLEGFYGTAAGATSTLRASIFEGEDRASVRASMKAPLEPADAGATATLDATIEIERLTPRAVDAIGEHELARDLPRSVSGRIALSGSLERMAFRAGLNASGARLDLDGVYAPADTRAQLCLTPVALARLFASLPDSVVGGCARIAIGDARADTFPARIEVRRATLGGDRLPDLRVEGTIDATRETVAVRSLVLPGAEPRGEDRLNVEGTVSAKGDVDLRLTARGFDPSDDPALRALLDGASGSFDATAAVKVDSKTDALEASLDAEIAGLAAPSVQARRLTVRARATGSVDAPRFEIVSRALRLEAGGFEVRKGLLLAKGTSESMVARLRGDLGHGERVVANLRGIRKGSGFAVEGGGTIGLRDAPFDFVLGRLEYD